MIPENPWLQRVPERSCPAPDKSAHIPMMRIEPGREYLFLPVEWRITGYYVHYLDGGTYPCPGSVQTCQVCQSGQFGPRWQGFLMGLWMPSQAPRVLSVTRGAYNNCLELQKADGNLHGKLLKVWRLGRKPNSPLKVVLTGEKSLKSLPKLPGVKEVLARMWGCEL